MDEHHTYMGEHHTYMDEHHTYMGEHHTYMDEHHTYMGEHHRPPKDTTHNVEAVLKLVLISAYMYYIEHIMYYIMQITSHHFYLNDNSISTIAVAFW